MAYNRRMKNAPGMTRRESLQLMIMGALAAPLAGCATSGAVSSAGRSLADPLHWSTTRQMAGAVAAGGEDAGFPRPRLVDHGFVEDV